LNEQYTREFSCWEDAYDYYTRYYKRLKSDNLSYFASVLDALNDIDILREKYDGFKYFREDIFSKKDWQKLSDAAEFLSEFEEDTWEELNDRFAIFN